LKGGLGGRGGGSVVLDGVGIGEDSGGLHPEILKRRMRHQTGNPANPGRTRFNKSGKSQFEKDYQPKLTTNPLHWRSTFDKNNLMLTEKAKLKASYAGALLGDRFADNAVFDWETNSVDKDYWAEIKRKQDLYLKGKLGTEEKLDLIRKDTMKA
jgi:hypothetical protein